MNPAIPPGGNSPCYNAGMPSDLVFLKLGGSLITDKGRAHTPRPDVIRRLALEIASARKAAPLRILIGHGSGSFGHWAAARYGTRQGVRSSEQWAGFAEVAAEAARLDRLVADAFLASGVPVLSLQPSASARCRDCALEWIDVAPLRTALARQLVPLVYGDVAFDVVQGGTIISTEDIFVYLAAALQPARILLVGEVPGVLDRAGHPVATIRPSLFPSLSGALAGSRGVDVTGGMRDKVTRMVELVTRCPTLTVHILSGSDPGTLAHALLQPDLAVGTRIVADRVPA